ncbi:MAG: alpha-amylase/4-alpha-glucanotransferase domain-containing protein [Chloroflexota bacterium]
METLRPSTRHNPPRPFELVDSRHGALVDHFLPLGTTYDEFAEGKHREFGDFVDSPYTEEISDLGGEARINMLRDGAIRAGKREAEVRLMKSAGARSGSSDLSVLYRIINLSMRPIQILFAVEYNLLVPGPAAEVPDVSDGVYLIDGAHPDDPSLSSVGRSVGATSLALANPQAEMALQLGWDRECDLWRMPMSGDEGIRAVRVVSVWRLSIAPDDNWALGLWLAPG